MFSSFSAVATREVKKEAAIMAYSVRRHYDCPILFVTDEETKAFLLEMKIPNLEFSMITQQRLDRIRREYASITEVNQFHRVDCIALKMECLTIGVSMFGDTMFLDTDIILREPIDDIPEGTEMMLSPHYNYAERVKNYQIYGVFNAGYLWTCMPDAGTIWKDIYLNRSSFYEQQGMIWFLEHFICSFFSQAHNVGFWRMPLQKTQIKPNPTLDPSVVNWDKVKSYHAHMLPECFAKADMGLKRVYSQNRDIVYKRLPMDLQRYVDEICTK